MGNIHVVEVNLAKTREATATRKASSPEKVHSRVFEANGDAENPITRSVYLNRPMSNGHTKARITVEFLD